MNEHNYWMVAETARMYREDRLREAEEYRLAAAAQIDQPQPASLAAHVLYSLGLRLSGWGKRLERRYRSAEEMSISPAGDCA